VLDYAHPVRKGEIMTITRIASGHRMSQAVVHNDTVYIAGQVAAPGQPVKAQTEAVLHQIDRLLEQAGSSKAHLLSATIWLADIADFEEMNSVWDAWVADVQPPARATGEVKLATPDYKVEIIVIAAKP